MNYYESMIQPLCIFLLSFGPIYIKFSWWYDIFVKKNAKYITNFNILQILLYKLYKQYDNKYD